ncbi:Resolvase%2C N terminal domain [Yersinia rohdei]|uniref:Resolvase, N terminal domain n=1 Tax=Yersinia rohdei TaxID=29485 RepID=A0A0U1HUR8_YERRO|nr:recombinase family protein [Yersinia rohdei]CQI92628.1 Resolvase%2C N terminal domain [Yersinia rohdei]
MTKLQLHVYTRISKTSQQEGSGLDEQLTRINSYIDDKKYLFDLNTIQYWQDVGVSAFKNKNIEDGSALGELLDKISTGVIGTGHALVVYSLDRLSRRSNWDEYIIQQIVKSGCVIHDVSTPIVLDRNDPMSKIIMELIISRANNESKIKSERSLSGWAAKVAHSIKTGAALTKHTPSWLRIDNGKYEVVEAEVKTIKYIFHDYIIVGLSAAMIAKKLNDSGDYVRRWRSNSVVKMLNDERLLGTLTRYREKTKIDNFYPAVIDIDIFLQAKNLLNINSSGQSKSRVAKSGGLHNIITGFTRCGCCGSKVTTTVNGKRQRFIKCRKRLDYLNCGAKSIKLVNFEQVVFQHLKQLDLSKIFKESNDDYERENLKLELASLQVDEKTIIDTIETRKLEKKKVSIQLLDGLTEIQDQIDDINESIQKKSNNNSTLDIGSIDISQLMNPDNIEIRMKLRKFIMLILNTVTFKQISKEHMLFEFNYKNKVLKHIIITDKKIENVLHEISIEGDDESHITYRIGAGTFIITEDVSANTVHLVGLTDTTSYFVLVNYIGSLGKNELVDFMFNEEIIDLYTTK